MNNLAVILSFDQPGSRRWRTCGKLAVSSLLRSLWDGEVRVVRNYEQPLFPTGRHGLLETVSPEFDHRKRLLGWRRNAEIGDELGKGGLRGEVWQRQVAREAALLLLFEEIAAMKNAADFGWVLLMDADCVVLRNLDHLFDRENTDILVSSRTAPDPGFVAVRGSVVCDLAIRWKTELEKRVADWKYGRAAALAATLTTGSWRTGLFEKGEVIRAIAPGISLTDLKNAAVVHFGAMDPKDKQRLAFAFHMMTVYGDEDGLFLDMLES